MNDNQFAGLNGFVWWVGVVEDRQDPLKLGRCRVRIFGWHSENITEVPTELLPWAQAMMPLNNPNPYTPKESDVVVGFFLDGRNAQTPVMMGVLPGIPLKEANPQQGFNDQRSASQLNVSPAKLEDTKTHYPRHIDEPTTSRLARNQSPTQVDLAKNNLSSQFERNPSYNATYPYNNAIESESGHAFELDDTPNNERINIFHRSGSHLEMRPDGSMQQKVLGDSVRVIDGNELEHVKGSKRVTIDGDLTYEVGGNVTFIVKKDFSATAKNITHKASAKFGASAGTFASISGQASVTASSLGIATLSGTMTTASGMASLKLSAPQIDLTNGGKGTAKDASTTTPTESATTAASSGSVVGEASYASLGQTTSTAVASGESVVSSSLGNSQALAGGSIVDITKNASGVGIPGSINQSPILDSPWSGYNNGMIEGITKSSPSIIEQSKTILAKSIEQGYAELKNLPTTVSNRLGWNEYMSSQSDAFAKWDIAEKTNRLKDYQNAASATLDATGKAVQIAVNAENLKNDVISVKSLTVDFCIGETAKQYVGQVKQTLKDAREELRQTFKNYSKSTTDMIENASAELKTKMNSFNEKSIDEWIDSHLYDNSCASCAQAALRDRNSGKTADETANLLSECLYREYKAIRDRQAGMVPVTSADIAKTKKKEC